MRLEGVEIIWDTESAFGITISNQEAQSLLVVEDLHRLVMAKLADTSPDTTEVWEKIRDIVIETTGVPRDQVKPGSRWPEVGVR